MKILQPNRVPAIGVLLFATMLGLSACGAPAAAVEQPAPAAIARAESPQQLTPQQYDTQFAQTGAAHQLIDVRTPEEFATGHIAGAVNIPVEELGGRLDEVNKDQPVVVYCRSGNRSAQAASILESAGHTGIYDLGGIRAWQQAGFPVQ